MRRWRSAVKLCVVMAGRSFARLRKAKALISRVMTSNGNVEFCTVTNGEGKAWQGAVKVKRGMVRQR